MLISLTALLLLEPAPQGSWPQTVEFDCQFSQVSHIARRDDAWAIVTDLGPPQERIAVEVRVPNGNWRLREGHVRHEWGAAGVVEAGASQFVLSHLAWQPYSLEAPPPTIPGSLLGTDYPTAYGRLTWTWFGGPDDVEAAMVRTFVSDRLVTTETGTCRRTQAQ